MFLFALIHKHGTQSFTLYMSLLQDILYCSCSENCTKTTHMHRALMLRVYILLQDTKSPANLSVMQVKCNSLIAFAALSFVPYKCSKEC